MRGANEWDRICVKLVRRLWNSKTMSKHDLGPTPRENVARLKLERLPQLIASAGIILSGVCKTGGYAYYLSCRISC